MTIICKRLVTITEILQSESSVIRLYDGLSDILLRNLI